MLVFSGIHEARLGRNLEAISSNHISVEGFYLKVCFYWSCLQKTLIYLRLSTLCGVRYYHHMVRVLSVVFRNKSVVGEVHERP